MAAGGRVGRGWLLGTGTLCWFGGGMAQLSCAVRLVGLIYRVEGRAGVDIVLVPGVEGS